ncbi:MAG: hypothetical protein C5B48_15020 [Candidatus Rokuibacteriota bacterium]|nr:MAG: hypothetical protein C5B48_15020 [Candidatus Rokubacteria bacterium]
MGDRRLHRQGLVGRDARLPRLRGGDLGAGNGRVAGRAGRKVLAAGLTSVAEIERELARLRAEEETGSALRTSVLTHSAWVPAEWLSAAESVLADLGERHPSRTIVLLPEPDAGENAIDAEVELERFSLGEQSVCSEVVRIRLRGDRAGVPASVLLPLLVADLPVFLRWRGRPTFGSSELEQLVDVADRVVVDSGEWPDLLDGYRALVPYFERSAWSDISWSRTLRWRRALAACWPEIEAVRMLHVPGPEAEAALLVGWLRSRLEREVELDWAEAAELAAVVADDGSPIEAQQDPRTPSDLLSDELERFTRDPVYEHAVTRAVAAT